MSRELSITEESHQIIELHTSIIFSEDEMISERLIPSNTCDSIFTQRNQFLFEQRLSDRVIVAYQLDEGIYPLICLRYNSRLYYIPDNSNVIDAVKRTRVANGLFSDKMTARDNRLYVLRDNELISYTIV